MTGSFLAFVWHTWYRVSDCVVFYICMCPACLSQTIIIPCICLLALLLFRQVAQLITFLQTHSPTATCYCVTAAHSCEPVPVLLLLIPADPLTHPHTVLLQVLAGT